MMNPMRILVRLVLNWKFLEIISICCATLSAIGCTKECLTFTELPRSILTSPAKMFHRKINSFRSCQYVSSKCIWASFECIDPLSGEIGESALRERKSSTNLSPFGESDRYRIRQVVIILVRKIWIQNELVRCKGAPYKKNLQYKSRGTW